MHYLATEHSLLTNRPSDDPTHVALPEAAFEALKAYALREDAEPVLRYTVQRGRHCLRVGAYVGLLRASDSVSIELLPKITPNSTPNAPSTSRAALLRMLLGSSQLFPRLLPEASLSRLANFPLPDVLAALFLQRAENLLHRGLVTAYHTVKAEQPFVKGKLVVQRDPFALLTKPHRLPVAFDERTRDNAPNRLLKACLQRLSGGVHARSVRQYLFMLDEVPESIDWRRDLDMSRRQDRTFQEYAWLLPWTEWLLGGQAPGTGAGPNQLPGLLFSTQTLFENYVATSLKRYLPNEFRVSLQESPHHLLYDANGRATHRLRPDVVVRRSESLWVLDTKWKLIRGDEARAGQLSASDLYQLHAYGQRYAAGTERVKLALLYPKTSDFAIAPPPLFYTPQLPLHLLPVDLSVPVRQMVETLWQRLAEQ